MTGPARSASSAPRVRVVVLNFDGGDTTLRCLRALGELDYPEDALDVLLVDNASIDGLVPQVRKELPWVRIIEHTHNVGFAGGCNLGLHDLDDVDHVALLNNDTIPDRRWLVELVDVLESDPTIGAVSSRMVFAPRFVSLTIDAPIRETAEGAVDDPRALGVRITGLATDGTEVWDHAQFADGCQVTSTRGTGDEQLCWTTARAEVRVPVDPDGELPQALEVELASDVDKRVTLDCGAGPVEVDVTPEPQWVSVPMGGRPYDVINNVGSRLVLGGYGGDRGFLEPDRGQYDEPAEVFAWCGGAVCCSAAYLRDVGIFDDRYFMYYEDTDLSWRGRLAGYRYQYVPTSIVRHEHAASSGEGSAMFTHYVERNRFLTLARNAPWSMVGEASYVFLRDTAVIAKREIVAPALRRGRPSPDLVVRRLRAYGAFVKLLPSALGTRARQRRSGADRREIVERWAVPQ